MDIFPLAKLRCDSGFLNLDQLDSSFLLPVYRPSRHLSHSVRPLVFFGCLFWELKRCIVSVFVTVVAPPPPPLPPEGFQGLSDEELRAMEGLERENVEARIRCLRNISTLLDAAVLQMQQYHSIVAPSMTGPRSVLMLLYQSLMPVHQKERFFLS